MSQINIYLKLKLATGGQVKGPCVVKGHEDDLILDTIRWGETNSSTPKGGTSRHLSVRDFMFTKRMCNGSAALLLACASGDAVTEAVIACRGANAAEKTDFLKWTLTDGIVSLYEIEADGKESVVPVEHVCIRFKTLAMEFKPNAGPTVSARVDVGANTATSG
jgi:type VI secretion system secreted protein Hcp